MAGQGQAVQTIAHVSNHIEEEEGDLDCISQRIQERICQEWCFKWNKINML